MGPSVDKELHNNNPNLSIDYGKAALNEYVIVSNFSIIKSSDINP